MATKVVRTKRGVSKAKTFEIYQSSWGGHKTRLPFDDKTIKIAKGGTLTTDDPGLARAIEEQHGRKGSGSLIVTELEAYNERRDRDIKRVNYIQGVALPWHVYDPDTGKRIK